MKTKRDKSWERKIFDILVKIRMGRDSDLHEFYKEIIYLIKELVNEKLESVRLEEKSGKYIGEEERGYNQAVSELDEKINKELL